MITPKHEGGWTLNTLHEYILSLIAANDRLYVEKFEAAEKAVQSALASADHATTKSEESSTKRFESVNEMRQMAVDNLRVTMPRLEQESINKALRDKIDAHEKRFDQLQGTRGGVRETVSYIIAAAGIIVAIIAIVYHK